MKISLNTLLIPLTLLCISLLLLSQVRAGDGNGPVLQMTINGAIGPATDDYLNRGIQHAQALDSPLIIVQMDTPGGLDTSMRSMIKNILASSIPVAIYVSPSGARAASAGTYLLYASHIAVMAPGTNLGAATPVQIGGLSPPSPTDPASEEDEPSTDASDTVPSNESAMRHKVVNDAAAYIRGLAQLRGRNEEWAERAVRASVSLSAEEALTEQVVDLVARDINDLLMQLDGYAVTIQHQTITLHTDGKTVQSYLPDWRNRLLGVLTDPNVAYILMLIGIYGLILEFTHPGSIVPGTVGAICLLLALFAFQLLPINYAGMALILLGIGLMVAEAFQPSFGMLGIGGVIAFVIGSIILMDTEMPGFGIDLSVILVFAITSALLLILLIGMAIRARHCPVKSGTEEMIGQRAIVLDDFEQNGQVWVHSERWSAVCEQPLKKDQPVRVTAVNGLVLTIIPEFQPTKES